MELLLALIVVAIGGGPFLIAMAVAPVIWFLALFVLVFVLAAGAAFLEDPLGNTLAIIEITFCFAVLPTAVFLFFKHMRSTGSAPPSTPITPLPLTGSSQIPTRSRDPIERFMAAMDKRPLID